MVQANNQRLPSFVERIERLEAEKRIIQEDIAAVKQEVRSAGFDVTVVNQIIRERRMTQYQREERIALAEIYRAALGMLNGTPLGEYARKRFDPPPEPDPQSAPDGEAEKTAEPQAKPEAKPGEPTAQDITAAREQGAQDMQNGLKITANPFPFGDPRRAAWDEGFCAAAGSDGMEIPDAWRRKPKKAPAPGKAP